MHAPSFLAPVGGSTVLASSITGFADHVRLAGADPERVMHEAGLHPQTLEAPNTPIALRGMCEALEGAARRSGDGNFGLRFGRDFAADDLGFLGHLAASAPTLGDGLADIARYFPLVQQSSALGLAAGAPVCRLHYRILDQQIARCRQDAELTLAQLCNVIRLATGADWHPLAIDFAHDAPADAGEHGEVFQADVRFGQPLNAIYFDAAILHLAMPRAAPFLSRLLKDSLEGLNRPQALPPSLVESVRGCIIRLLPEAAASIEAVADRLALPSWTLRRRLGEAGINFRSLVEEVRREEADRLLAQRHLPMTEIAFRLGYSEVSAFSRAFQRWHDCPPTAWRRARLDYDPGVR